MMGDIGRSLPELMEALVEVTPLNCRIRLGMTNPPYILEHLERMAIIMSDPRVYAFLHIPVQSGSDSVLQEMKREYCRKDFEHVVDFFRQKIPRINIATDVICGFPTETEDDFQDTLSLIQKYKFQSLFINQFFARPGTPAARMKRKVESHVAKERTKRVSDFFNSYNPFSGRIGTEEKEVLVTEESRDGKFFVGHNRYYEQILVERREEWLGRMLWNVIVTEVGKHYMVGRVVVGDGQDGCAVEWKKVLVFTCVLVLLISIFLKLFIQ